MLVVHEKNSSSVPLTSLHDPLVFHKFTSTINHSSLTNKRMRIDLVINIQRAIEISRS